MKKLIISAVLATACLLPTAASAQRVGDWVLSPWQDARYLYPGVIVARGPGTVTVRFDDGAVETRMVRDVRPYSWRVGSGVTCRWTDGEWYDAVIEMMGSDGLTLGVRYVADGVRQRTNTGRCRTRG